MPSPATLRPLASSAAPAQVRQFAAKLLDQQMWCFGQDIRHADGNLLLRYGLTRLGCPDGGTSSYISSPGPGEQVRLWGFGLFFGATGGGVFLARFRFEPAWTDCAAIPDATWQPADVPRLRTPRADAERQAVRGLLRRAAEWLAGYEQWVIETATAGWRRGCLERWSKPRTAPEACAGHWRDLGRRLGMPST